MLELNIFHLNLNILFLSGIGCVWVYHVFQPIYTDEKNPGYCNYTVYILDLSLLTITFVVHGCYSFLKCCRSIFQVMDPCVRNFTTLIEAETENYWLK